MHPYPVLGFAPAQWLRKSAPIKLKPTVAFGTASVVASIGTGLWWWVVGPAAAVAALARPQLQHVGNVMASGRIVPAIAMLLSGYVFLALIAVACVAIVHRMVGLAPRDLDRPIPFSRDRGPAPAYLCTTGHDVSCADHCTEAMLVADQAGHSPAGGAEPAGRRKLPLPSRPGLPSTQGPETDFDEALFTQTAGYLPQEMLKLFLQTMASRGRTLSDGIRNPDLRMKDCGDLVDLAHTLSGSAGMFGFRRLAGAARRYEYAVQSHAPDAAAAVSELDDATERAMEIVGRKMTEVFHAAAKAPAGADMHNAKLGAPADAD